MMWKEPVVQVSKSSKSALATKRHSSAKGKLGPSSFPPKEKRKLAPTEQEERTTERMKYTNFKEACLATRRNTQIYKSCEGKTLPMGCSRQDVLFERPARKGLERNSRESEYGGCV